MSTQLKGEWIAFDVASEIFCRVANVDQQLLDVPPHHRVNHQLCRAHLAEDIGAECLMRLQLADQMGILADEMQLLVLPHQLDAPISANVILYIVDYVAWYRVLSKVIKTRQNAISLEPRRSRVPE